MFLSDSKQRIGGRIAGVTLILEKKTWMDQWGIKYDREVAGKIVETSWGVIYIWSTLYVVRVDMQDQGMRASSPDWVRFEM